jgi:hypothetical protein
LLDVSELELEIVGCVKDEDELDEVPRPDCPLVLVPWPEPERLDPVVPPAPVLELPEDPPPVPPVVCAFMLAAAATSRAEVNANVFFFIVRFLLLGNVGSPPPANRHLAAPCTGDRETYIRENC